MAVVNLLRAWLLVVEAPVAAIVVFSSVSVAGPASVPSILAIVAVSFMSNLISHRLELTLTKPQDRPPHPLVHLLLCHSVTRWHALYLGIHRLAGGMCRALERPGLLSRKVFDPSRGPESRKTERGSRGLGASGMCYVVVELVSSALLRCM